MARKIRIQYSGAVYHVMSRGNRQEAIFRDDRDCEVFLDTLGEACGRCGWRVHAFVLMGNHYHLLLETPHANLVEGMKWLQGTYTQRFNARHKVWGHLLQGRYKALVVDSSDRSYFMTVSNYIHLNPARAKLFNLQDGALSDYRWSSYPGMIRPSKRPEWLCVKRMLGNLGLTDDTEGRAKYRQFMQKRVLEVAQSDDPRDADEEWDNIRTGWFFGADEFRTELMQYIADATSNVRRDSLEGAALRSHDGQAAETLLSVLLKAAGLRDEDLQALPKGAREKKLLAWGLRMYTTVSREWIAKRLNMGHVSRVTQSVGEVKVHEGYLKERARLQKIIKLSD
jgi:REP element-mobilizing transposase RayT